MAFEHFKPTLWSTRFIVNTDKALVAKNVVDMSWTIVGGKALKINEIGDVTITDYGSTGISIQDIPDAQKEFPVDQQSYFAFKIQDVDAAQMNVNVMNGAMDKAAHAMADTIDQYILGKYGEAGITNATNLGSAASGLNLYANLMPDLITYMLRYLKESNAPGPYWCIAPPWFMQLIGYGMITYGNAQFDAPNSVGASAPTAPAFPFMGINFWESNNVAIDTTNSEYAIMFGSFDAIGYTSQIEKVEAFRRENYFDDAVKGLTTYGAKVVRPDHLGVAYANFTGLTT
jgi:hypothetical protein